MNLSTGLQGRVLVKLSGVTQELTVGVSGTLASVRTLTDVSLEIFERELVVLSGNRGAGERAVLSVIAGDRRGVTGRCEIRPHTRIRHMRISAQAALALTQEWQRLEVLAYSPTRTITGVTNARTVVGESDARTTPTGETDARIITSEIEAPILVGENNAESVGDEMREFVALTEALRNRPGDEPRDLILLDVVRNPSPVARGATQPRRVAESRVLRGSDARLSTAASGTTGITPHGVSPWDEKNRAALLAWAAVCRLRGGAVVMAAGDAVGNGLFDAALSHVRPQDAPHMRISAVVREARFDSSTVRVVPMHSGRLAAPVRLRVHDLVL